jgi:hypothetical protein
MLESEASKTVAVLLSTMRSGSTLLKALLATAPDVSDLPETDFQRFTGERACSRLCALGPEPILVLKRPAWFNEIGRYPRLPEVPRLKRIVLVRDAYPNVLSIRRMLFRHVPLLLRTNVGNRFLVERYWFPITERLAGLAAVDPIDTRLVRYEDVLEDPEGETARLFEFLGSARTEGTATYGAPADYEWKWGSDDGGERIRTLSVGRPREETSVDTRLAATISRSASVSALRRRLGYSAPP